MNIFFFRKKTCILNAKKILTYPAKENIHYNEYE